MGIKARTVALAGALAISLASLAFAANVNEAKVGLTLGEKGKNKPTSMKLSAKISNKGQEKGPGQIEIILPKGAAIDPEAAGQCTTSASSPDDCPNSSKVGHGVATFFSTDYDLVITNMESNGLIIWAEIGTNSYFPLDATIDGRKITSQMLAVSKLTINIDKVTDGGAAFFTTPPNCPNSGKWTSTVKTTYFNESGAGDDQVETDKPKTPCTG
jgi:hypothetical protein